MTELLLARHGETEWNRERRWQGHADPPLNDAGRAQARELAEGLVGERLEAIYSSDLRRAYETAEIAGAHLGVPVTSDPDLREIDVGSWSGLTREQLEGRVWDGETTDAHAERVLRAVRRIIELHPEGRVLIVTHGGSVRRLFEQIGETERPAPANCEVYRLAAQLLD